MHEASVSRALARAAMAHRTRAAELLATIGLHPGQEFLLAALGDHGVCAVGELAEYLGVEQPTVTKMLRRIEASGVIERHADPNDGRRTLVALTDEGRTRLAAAQKKWDLLDQVTTDRLTGSEVEVFIRLLEEVRTALDEQADPQGP